MAMDVRIYKTNRDGIRLTFLMPTRFCSIVVAMDENH